MGSVLVSFTPVRHRSLAAGFTTLWSHHRLDLTVEAHVLKHDYTTLFSDADRQQARRRLELYGWQEKPGEAT